MNTHTFEHLADRIENLKCEPTHETILEITNILAELVREVKRIDWIACKASDTASCLANGIQPD